MRACARGCGSAGALPPLLAPRPGPPAKRTARTARARAIRTGLLLPAMGSRRRMRVAALVAGLLALAGCGGAGSGTPQLPKAAAARTFDLVGFQPAGTIGAGRPTTVSF